MRIAASLSGLLLCCLPWLPARASEADRPLVEVAASGNLATPGVQGFAPWRLQRLERFMRDATGPDGYPGAVVLVARNGQPVMRAAFGHRDIARSTPMREDSIFRVFSMTKTVATVAVLILMEEGRLALEDPVAAYLPEYAALQVMEEGDAGAPRRRDAKQPLTIRHLLTHTAGFTGAADGSVQGKLLDAQHLDHARDLADFTRRLAQVPLASDPGTRFAYDGVQLEVASRIVEVVSGQPFDRFVQQRILTPLAMVDTGFSVPVAQRHRVVELSRMSPAGRLVRDGDSGSADPGSRLRPYASGAGGLYSTAPDFLRFCQMLLDGGTLDGVSILGRKTVASMMANQLGHLDPPVTQFSPAEGFGLGGYVVLDPALRGRLGSVGQYGWSGAASTYFTIDPQERLIAILLLQHLPDGATHDLPRLPTRFYNLVYQALER